MFALRPGRLVHRVDARALDRAHVPRAARVLRAIATCVGPSASHDSVEPERVIEVGQRVELHRLAVPFALDARAQLSRAAAPAGRCSVL